MAVSRWKCGVLVAAAGVCGSAAGQCATVTRAECNTFSVLGENQTWVTEDPAWTINRYPGVVLTLRNGNYCQSTGGNSLGLTPWWYDNDDSSSTPTDANSDTVPDVFENLISRMDAAFSEGWTRILIYLPAGGVGDQAVSSSQWWSMPSWRRDGFRCYLKAWIDEHPGVGVELYSAFKLNDPDSPCMSSNSHSIIEIQSVGNIAPCIGSPSWYYPCDGASSARVPDAHNQQDRCDFDANIAPWMAIGLKRFWLDEGVYPASRDKLREFAYADEYFGLAEFGVEAYPLTGSPEVPDASALPDVPYIGWHDYVNTIGYTSAYSVSPTTTEVARVMRPPNTSSIDDMWDLADAGYVLYIDNPDLSATDTEKEWVKRIYDFGLLVDAGDFDGDGVTDADDLDRFLDAYALYESKTDANWVHGDVNQDDSVDIIDYFTFLTNWDLSVNSADPQPIDLGSAEPGQVFR